MKCDKLMKLLAQTVTVGRTTVFISVLLLVVIVSVSTTGEAIAKPNELVVRADKGKDVINRNIYGHFSEHLGRCIYGGFWVGEDSPIPNTRGIRNDVVKALRKIKIRKIVTF